MIKKVINQKGKLDEQLIDTIEPNFVFKRIVILEKVWGTDIVVGDRTIDVHIRKLREKIGSQYITTIKGIGYKFNN